MAATKRKANQPAVEPPSVPGQPGCPIAGIGASAGGLAAFEAFFSGMPAGSSPGMAFVLVQHLAPDHKSILTDLVKRYTRMRVFEVADGMAVQPNCAYIIPPNRDMALLNGTLQLLDPIAPRGQRLPIDFFFSSLAQDQHERAICIVLSGTGSDGTLGVRAVKGEGGMVMAQNPESTEYDGMPRSAIATGLVDYVLPPAEMPAQLIAYVAHAFGRLPAPVSAPSPKAEDALKKIFVLLRVQTGHDFSGYKRNTVARRVERRMAVHQIERLEQYVSYLQQTPAEVEALFRDLMIGVTRFFRDREAFLALQEEAIPRLFADRPADTVLRIWVPGCSTGEEAYSIAILLQERMDALKMNFKLQAFGTDIDRRAIDQARLGVYPAGVAADVSPERLEHFFTREPGGGYRIRKLIREMLIFSEHDLIKDPPFSKLDLISCRNLLIYMEADLQKKIIPLFHYALNPGGFLFLGNSETAGEIVDLFAPMDRKSKLFQRKVGAGAYNQRIGSLLPGQADEASAARRPGKAAGSRPWFRELTEAALLQNYAPACALIDARGDILYLHGRTGQYLEPAPGEAGMNILKMAREGLRRELTTALHKVVAHEEPARHAGLRVKTNGGFTTVNLAVHRVSAVPDSAVPRDLFLVILENAPEPDPAQLERIAAADAASEANYGGADADARIAVLQNELRAKDEYLQTSNEELATANEELTSSNEEMQSVNEELQSTNEELETSKEEMQSLNEELATVNGELQAKVADLTRVNNDLNNLMAGTGVGTVFVDHHLRIQRYNPPATELINLIPTDIGRPLGHTVSNMLGYDNLVADVRAVLEDLTPREAEVRIRGDAWYLLRIRPYRTSENVIEGAVITFTEVTEMKKAQAALRESQTLRRLAVVVRDAHDAITVQDLQGRILAWNPGAERMYGWSEAEALHMNICDLVPEGQRKEALATLRRRRKGSLEPRRVQRVAKDGRIVDVSLIATALVNEVGDAYAVATTEREIDQSEAPHA